MAIKETVMERIWIDRVAIGIIFYPANDVKIPDENGFCLPSIKIHE